MLDIETGEASAFLDAQASALRADAIAAETNVLRGDPGHMIALDADESSSPPTANPACRRCGREAWPQKYLQRAENRSCCCPRPGKFIEYENYFLIFVKER
jgi:hypothetical protein